MALLEERLDTVEERTDRLETLFGMYLWQTALEKTSQVYSIENGS
jgi:hypothetical protein